MHSFSNITTHDITYTIPLNETMRLLLRLNSLFENYQTLLFDHPSSLFDAQLSIVLRLIAVTDRADLKSKITQFIHQLMYRLQQWQHHTEASQKPITQALDECRDYLTYFEKTRDKIGQELRDHFFVKQLLSQYNHPGGLSDFSLPMYALWQRQTEEQKSHNIHTWMQTFEPLKNCIQLLLHFIHKNSDCQTVNIKGGFHQQPIETRKTIQLFQVLVPLNLNIYPIMSVGRHHVSIHFHQVLEAGFDQSEIYTQPFMCKLCYCDL
jgi:cell division protein ZapD